MKDFKHDTSMSSREPSHPVLAKLSNRQLSWARSVEERSTTRIAMLLATVYRFRLFRRYILTLVKRLEGGEMHSSTLRRLLQEFHHVRVGRYSYGPCLIPGVLPPKSSVGNYCSIAEGMRVFRRNHPSSFLSQHPFFYNNELGLVAEDTIEQVQDNPLEIGHDVWIGHGVTILAGCRQIGNGAIVGAGSVVTKDIPPFTVFAGNPARFIRNRYCEEVRDLVARTRWWDLPLQDLLLRAEPLLYKPITQSGLREFLSQQERSNAANA